MTLQEKIPYWADWYYMPAPKTEHGPLDNFPSYYTRTGKVSIYWSAYSLNELASMLGCSEQDLKINKEHDTQLTITCNTPPERWPLVKDALNVLSKMKYLPYDKNRAGTYAKVQEIVAFPGSKVEITLDLNDRKNK